MSIQALAMGADGSVVAGGSQGRVARWSGEWELLRKKKGAVQDVWVSPSGAVWIAGAALEQHTDKLRKQKVVVGDDGFMCVWGRTDTDVWASGYGPEVAQWDGASWTLHNTGLSNSESSYIAGIAGHEGFISVGGENGIAVFDHDQWRVIEDSVETTLNGSTTLRDGRVAFVGVSSDGPEVWIGNADGFETIVVEDEVDTELQRVAAGPEGRLYFTDGGAVFSWFDGDLQEELRCSKWDCYAVASNGIGVVAATHEGVWLLEDEWRLIGKP